MANRKISANARASARPNLRAVRTMLTSCDSMLSSGPSSLPIGSIMHRLLAKRTACAQESVMDEASVRARLLRHWEFAGSDQDITHEIYAEDAVLEFPQS